MTRNLTWIGVLGLGLLAASSLACGGGKGGSENADEVSGSGESGESQSGGTQEGAEQDGSGSQDGSGTQDGSSTQDGSTDAGTQDGSTDTTDASTTDASTTDASTTDASTTDASTTDATTTDTGVDTNIQEFCDKVDFLFVIDNSISMLPEQTALGAAFPGFIQAIEASLDTDDHIMVNDTDLIGWCTPANCANPQNLHPTCEGPDSYACTGMFDDCDITLGAGVVRPAGQGASNTFCDPFGGNRYIIEDEPDKLGTFDCMAHVGLAGFSLERPVDTMVQAVSANLEGPGGCNEGFLRDDAILVITFISDDDGNNEVYTMQEAYDALVAAKGGDADRIVMLGLTPGPDNNCSGTPGAGEHWVQLIEMFGARGLHGPSCAADYVEFFQGAVDVIVQACMDNPQ